MDAYSRGEPLDLAALPYRQLRALVAARHGVAPAVVDDWPIEDVADVISVLGVDV